MVVVAGVLSWQEQASAPEQATPMIVIPLELVTIGDISDVAPMVDTKNVKEEAAAPEDAEAYASASAPKPEEDTVDLEAAVAPPKKEETEKKPEVKPAPAKKEEDLNSFLDSMLTDVKKDKPKAAPAPAGKTASPTTGTTMGTGEKRRMQLSVADYIRTQLVNKQCWTDHSDMADAIRLKTTIRVWFGRDGKFAREPELREPSRPPTSDVPLATFIAHAQRALAMCNAKGWQIPPEYFKLEPQPHYIDIEFVPKVGAQ